jgi:MFS family permease
VSPASLSSSGYRTLLGLPAIRWQMATGLLAQVTQGAGAVGIILVVRQHAGSLALAGGVVAALSIAAGVARPLQGRLIDRRGSREVMAFCGVIHALALAGIVVLSDTHANGGLLVVLGCLAGLALPPVSASMRVEWAEVVAGDDHTATYSLVYLTQELAILAGPLMLAGMIAAASASLALIAVAAFAAAGTVGFAASVRSPSDPGSPHAALSGLVLRIRGLQLVLAVALLVGGVIGALEVAAPTLATAHHAPAAAGLLIASLSVGGILGAVIYGSRRWRARPPARLLQLLALLTAALALMIAAHGLLAVAALLLLGGIALNPALTTFSLLIDQHVSAQTAGEAFGWLSTAIAGGTGAANIIAAAVAQHQHDARAAFVVAAIAGAAATAVSLLARPTLDHIPSVLR